MLEQDPRVDLHALIAALPTPCLLLDPDRVVRSASMSFYALTGRTPGQVLHRPMRAPFPSNPADPRAREGEGILPASIQRVFDTGAPDRLAPLRHDIEMAPGQGEFVERWWSVTNVPVMGSDGTVPYVLNLVQDVSDIVRERDRTQRLREREELLVERTERLQTDLSARMEQVQLLSDAEAQSGRRLQGLAHVALELAAAESVEELTDLVVGRGVAAMGCDGGGIAVRDDDAALIRLSSTIAGRGPRHYQEVALTERIPAVVAAVFPRPIYLGTRAEGLAWGPQMQRVYDTSNRNAWASLPLQASGRLLGSLTVSWVHERAWSAEEKGLLAAFAAQCAQALQRIQVREAERKATASSRLLSESLQRSLLTDPPQVRHLDLVARYQPASREAYVGGDWYDAFQLPGGPLVLVIGDVTGHDRVATAAMAQVRGVLRGVAHSVEGSSAEVLSSLDGALRDLSIDTIATAVLARMEPGPTPGSQRFQWTNAGHPPPLLLRADGETELLQPEPELLLGVQPSVDRTDHECLLLPGDTVLMYTDGLVERRDDSLTNGLEWLRARAASLAGLPLETLCDELLAELPGDAEDDVALIAARALPLDQRSSVSTGPGTGPIAMPPPAAPLRTEPATAGLRLAHRAAIVLIPETSSVRRARAFVMHHCKVAGVSPDACDTVALLTSETVTNAFIHGRSEARLRLLARLGRIRVEVGDDNARHPQRASRNDDALDGRGLDILDLLSADWGVLDEPAGKVVWFEVRDDQQA